MKKHIQPLKVLKKMKNFNSDKIQISRARVCNNLLCYGAYIGQGRILKLANSLKQSKEEKFTDAEISMFYDAMSDEFEEYHTQQRTKLPDIPFSQDYCNIIAELPQAIKKLKNISFPKGLDPDLIRRAIQENNDRKYQKFCFKRNIDQSMRPTIYFGDKYDLLFCIMWIIVNLFQYGFISVKNTSTERDTECKNILSKFDGRMNFKEQSGTKDILYHLKNSIAHGHVEIGEYDVKFTDVFNRKKTFEGRIDLKQLTTDILLLENDLENLLLNGMSFTDIFDVIRTILKKEKLLKDQDSAMLAVFHFMAVFENNYAKIKALFGADDNIIILLNQTFTTPSGLSAISIRNGMSHRMDINDGKIVTYGTNGNVEYKLSSGTMTGLSDFVSVMGDVLLFKLSIDGMR